MCLRLLGLVSSGNVGTHCPSVNLLFTQLCRSVIFRETLQANVKDYLHYLCVKTILTHSSSNTSSSVSKLLFHFITLVSSSYRK